MRGMMRMALAAVSAVLTLTAGAGSSVTAQAMSARDRKATEKLYSEAVGRYGRNALGKKSGTVWCAHRGYSGLAPENTEAAIELAGMCGADAVEVDVRMSKDGGLYLMHDGNVNRMTDGKGRIENMTSEQVEALRANGGRNRRRFKSLGVCRFDKCLRICRKRGVCVMIEVKPVRTKARRKEIVRRIYETIKKERMFGRCAVSSFDFEVLKEWRKKDKSRVPVRICGFSRLSAKKKREWQRMNAGYLPAQMRGFEMSDNPVF